MARIAAVGLATLVVLVLGACGSADPGSSEAGPRLAASWERLPDPPLSPRVAGLALWTGEEALVLGGSDADPCPANASCVAPREPPLRDGAAFDPERRTWSRIAPAPVGFSFAEGALAGETAYVMTHGEPGRPRAPRAFLAYRYGEDRWEKLPLPPGDGDRSIVAAGERVVAYSGSDESGEAPDLIFDPAAGEWSELPDDPLPRSFGRTMAWSGRELVLFAHELVPQPGSEEPSLVIAAALDLDAGEWRRLPDSEILGSGARWFELDGRLVLPALGGADGGEVGNWGRTYPNGGVLDPQRGEWADLPDASGEEFSVGILGASDADYFGHRGAILDATANEWIEIPPLDGEDTTDRVVVAAGLEMLVVGGVRWDGSGLRSDLLDEAWSWAPRVEEP